MSKKLIYDGKRVRGTKCTVCRGTGQLEDECRIGGKFVKVKTLCLLCSGTGYAKQICGKRRSLKKLYVHHNHKTGKVVGLLCNGCNFKLGWVEKHFNTLIRYIKG